MINMNENLTTEQIEKSINAAFDSVNLIIQLKNKENLSNEEKNILERNIKHLEIMMNKEWFKNALTAEQTNQINNLITK